MAIRKLDANTINNMSETPHETEYVELSIEDAEYLLNKASEEIDILAAVVNSTVDCFNNSCFGQELLATDESYNFVNSMAYYLTEVIPKLLKGDIDSIIEESDPENYESRQDFEDSLEQLRIRFFENLSKRYLNN